MPSLKPREARRRPAAVARKRTLKTYDPESLSNFFSWCTVGSVDANGEQRLYCPMCEDPATSRSASASINAAKGEWNCLKGSNDDPHGGSIEELLAWLKTERGMTSAVGTIRRAVPKSRAKDKLPPELPNPEFATVDAFAMLRSKRFESRMVYLTTERGLNPKTIDKFQIGYDGTRYTVPIRSADGVIRNVKKYLKGNSGRAKWIGETGHNTAMLAFTPELAANSHQVVITEGEFDAILTNQALAGFPVVALAVTGGAGSVPRYLDDVKGREVFIAFDCDDAGSKGAQKLGDALRKVAAKVHVLDLTDLGLRPGTGEDLTDYWMRGGTPEDFRDYLQRVRKASAAEHDDILAAMEAGFLEMGSPRNDYTPLLLSEDDVLALSPLQYSIDTFVPRGMFTSIYGPPGSKKTFIAQDMGNCIRAGIPWHGHAVSPGAVLMLEAEGLQQLQPRILAWAEHHDHPELRPFRVLDEPLDLSSPDGAAALVRTVRGMESAVGERVELIVVDPAALYMSGSENEDGNRDLARGLNVVAKYLDVGLIVIMHTNASGERARGTDHFRMLAGSHIRIEVADDGNTAVLQEKVKNTEARAVVLRPISVGASLAFETVERMTAAGYSSHRASSERQERATERIVMSEAKARAARSVAESALLEAVAKSPGLGKSKLIGACKGRGAGYDTLDAALDALIAAGTIRTESKGSAVNSPRRHYLAETSDP